MRTLEDYIKENIHYPIDEYMSYLDFNISDKDRYEILARMEKYEKERKRLTHIISKKFTKNDIKKFESINRDDSEADAFIFVNDKVLKYFYSNPNRPKTFFLNDDNSTAEYKGHPLTLKSDEPKKLKIGVKRIKETEAIIKNQEKTIKGKKKQILNEQEYLNTMGKIMTGESNFIDNKGKWAVATELDVKDGLNPKIRRALKKSIIEEANKIKGNNIKNKKKQILNEQEYLNNVGTIMSCKSELININGKCIVEISFNIKKDLDPKIKRALKKSIIEQANFI